MIIIPDIHGRTFWKDAVSQTGENEKVIFLGDYLEPYTNIEGITSTESYNNFIEILDYKKKHMDSCVLLLGNHDFACISKDMITCRHDYQNETRNKRIFTNNYKLFQIGYSEVINNKKYILTHAGIHREWLELLISHNNAKVDINKIDIVNYINNMFETDRKTLQTYLALMSRYRGGRWATARFGSCIWADLNEWIDKANYGNPIEFEGTYQIFGHTLNLYDIPTITENFACLDVRNAWKLYDSGKLEKITNYIYLG